MRSIILVVLALSFQMEARAEVATFCAGSTYALKDQSVAEVTLQLQKSSGGSWAAEIGVWRDGKPSPSEGAFFDNLALTRFDASSMTLSSGVNFIFHSGDISQGITDGEYMIQWATPLLDLQYRGMWLSCKTPYPAPKKP